LEGFINIDVTSNSAFCEWARHINVAPVLFSCWHFIYCNL